MTVFEVRRVFSGVYCPHCNERITIHFNSENLFTLFDGFKPENNKKCCAVFRGQLNALLSQYREGDITEMQLTKALSGK